MIDILIPLMRKQRIDAICRNVEETTSVEHTTHIIMEMPSISPTVLWKGVPAKWWCPMVEKTYADRVNFGYSVTDEPFFFLGADDLKFHPGWAEAALKTMEEVDGVVGINDLHNPNPTHFLVSRSYIEEFGSGTMDDSGKVLHPYTHNYTDLELAATAKRRGRFAYCEESVIEHCHPCAGKAEDDEVYQLGRQSYAEDEALHASRTHLWS